MTNEQVVSHAVQKQQQQQQQQQQEEEEEEDHARPVQAAAPAPAMATPVAVQMQRPASLLATSAVSSPPSIFQLATDVADPADASLAVEQPSTGSGGHAAPGCGGSAVAAEVVAPSQKPSDVGTAGEVPAQTAAQHGSSELGDAARIGCNMQQDAQRGQQNLGSKEHGRAPADRPCSPCLQQHPQSQRGGSKHVQQADHHPADNVTMAPPALVKGPEHQPTGHCDSQQHAERQVMPAGKAQRKPQQGGEHSGVPCTRGSAPDVHQAQAADRVHKPVVAEQQTHSLSPHAQQAFAAFESVATDARLAWVSSLDYEEARAVQRLHALRRGLQHNEREFAAAGLQLSAPRVAAGHASSQGAAQLPGARQWAQLQMSATVNPSGGVAAAPHLGHMRAQHAADDQRLPVNDAQHAPEDSSAGAQSVTLAPQTLHEQAASHSSGSVKLSRSSPRNPVPPHSAHDHVVAHRGAAAVYQGARGPVSLRDTLMAAQQMPSIAAKAGLKAQAPASSGSACGMQGDELSIDDAKAALNLLAAQHASTAAKHAHAAQLDCRFFERDVSLSPSASQQTLGVSTAADSLDTPQLSLSLSQGFSGCPSHALSLRSDALLSQQSVGDDFKVQHDSPDSPQGSGGCNSPSLCEPEVKRHRRKERSGHRDMSCSSAPMPAHKHRSHRRQQPSPAGAEACSSPSLSEPEQKRRQRVPLRSSAQASNAAHATAPAETAPANNAGAQDAHPGKRRHAAAVKESADPSAAAGDGTANCAVQATKRRRIDSAGSVGCVSASPTLRQAPQEQLRQPWKRSVSIQASVGARPAASVGDAAARADKKRTKGSPSGKYVAPPARDSTSSWPRLRSHADDRIADGIVTPALA